MELIIFIIVDIGFGFLCEYLGKLKGQKGCFLYGLFLSFIGVIIVLCLKDKSKETSNNENNINKYKQLEQLKNLKESGTITDKEFEEEKKKVLNIDK